MNPYNVKGNGRRRLKLLRDCPIRRDANKAIAKALAEIDWHAPSVLPPDTAPSESMAVLRDHGVVP